MDNELKRMVVLEEKDIDQLIKDVEDGMYDDVYLDERCQAHWYWEDLRDALEHLLRIGRQNSKALLENEESTK